MRIKSAIRFVLFLVLSLPAFALQPEHDDSLTFFRANFHSSGPQASLRAVSEQRAVMNDEVIQLLFSAFTALMVVSAIRSQQRQDYSKYRQCKNHN